MACVACRDCGSGNRVATGLRFGLQFTPGVRPPTNFQRHPLKLTKVDVHYDV
jgi:hypothetical protein